MHSDSYERFRTAFLEQRGYNVRVRPAVWTQSRPDQEIGSDEAQWFEEAAEHGIVSAQCILGALYEHGEGGLPQDYAEALRWYRLAAEQGYATAQYLLGTAYFHGRGVPQFYGVAHRWYKAAAEQGHAWAQCSVGSMHLGALGVKQDFIAAYAWLSAATKEKGAAGPLPVHDRAVESLDKTTELMTDAEIVEGQRAASELWKRLEENRKPDLLRVL